MLAASTNHSRVRTCSVQDVHVFPEDQPPSGLPGLAWPAHSQLSQSQRPSYPCICKVGLASGGQTAPLPGTIRLKTRPATPPCTYFIGGVAVGKLRPTRACQRSIPRNFLFPPSVESILFWFDPATHHPHPPPPPLFRIRITSLARQTSLFYLLSSPPSPNFYFRLPPRRISFAPFLSLRYPPPPRPKPSLAGKKLPIAKVSSRPRALFPEACDVKSFGLGAFRFFATPRHRFGFYLQTSPRISTVFAFPEGWQL